MWKVKDSCFFTQKYRYAKINDKLILPNIIYENVLFLSVALLVLQHLSKAWCE
jgi:hypothetical protein